MEPSLPITQDLLTVPRTLPSGPINLIGIGRSLMSERLCGNKDPRETGENESNPNLAMDLSKRYSKF